MHVPARLRSARAVWLRPVALVAALLAGCGGSGSSGFDPAGFEAPLIEQAIAEMRCVEGASDLLICPSGATVHDPNNGMPSPGPTDLRVDASVERGAVDCNASGCTFQVHVSLEGLPAGAEARVAVRAAAAERWSVGAPLVLQASTDAPGVVEPVGGPLTAGVAPGGDVQVAVLVFLPPLGDVPAEVAELRETGARYAFVLAPVPVRTASP